MKFDPLRIQFIYVDLFCRFTFPQYYSTFTKIKIMKELLYLLPILLLLACTKNEPVIPFNTPETNGVQETLTDGVCEGENPDLFDEPWFYASDSTKQFTLYADGTTDPLVIIGGNYTQHLPSSWEYIDDGGCYCENLRWYINVLETPDSVYQDMTIVKLTPDSLVTYSPYYNTLNTFLR